MNPSTAARCSLPSSVENPEPIHRLCEQLFYALTREVDDLSTIHRAYYYHY